MAGNSEKRRVESVAAATRKAESTGIERRLDGWGRGWRRDVSAAARSDHERRGQHEQ
jgi:hypothetical protein